MAENLQAVIYEVNLSVDVDVIERFDEWLQLHTKEMLAIPGFISAATSVPDVDDESQKHRCVQYRLSDKAALDDYLNHHAERMRNKADLAFEGKFTAKRRVLSIAEAALAEHSNCANCGAELTGRFCTVCGQREEPRVPTIQSVLGEFTNEVFGIESKLWRSFRLLLFKPGQLTLVYLSGMRQKYMSPLRLYLLFSIATFAYFALLNNQGLFDVSIEASDNQEMITGVENEMPNTDSTSISEDGSTSSSLPGEVDSEIERRVRSTIVSIQKDIDAGNRQAVISKFIKPLPKALFLFLPFIALLLKFLYLGSGKYYVEHLVYVLHNHAFLFAILLFTTFVSQIVSHQPQFEIFIALGITLVFAIYAFRPLHGFLVEKFSKSRVKAVLYLLVISTLFTLLFRSALSSGISTIFVLMWGLYVPYYVYRSMRVVYQRPRWVTLPTLAVISVMYLVLLLIMLLGSAFFVGITYN